MFPTPDGTVQSQFPTVVNVRIVSPLAAVVVVGTHAAALAAGEKATWLGIATRRLRSNIQEIEVGRDLLRVARLRRRISKITFTS
jgi:hypothetical protein